MRYLLLGPVEALDEGGALALGRGKRREVLAMLVLAGGAPASRERLAESLWDEDGPASWNTLQAHVSRLRKDLQAAGEQLTIEPGGYALRVDPEDVDLYRFERLVASAESAPAADAARLLGDALALWRGPALADLTSA